MPLGAHVRVNIPNLEARNRKRARKGVWLLNENAVIESIDNHNFTLYVTGREYNMYKIKSELSYPKYKAGEIVQYRPRDEDGGPFIWSDAVVKQPVPPILIDNQWCDQ